MNPDPIDWTLGVPFEPIQCPCVLHRETIEVTFLRGVSALSFGCLTTKALGFAPTAVRVAGAKTTLAFGPIERAQSRALDDLLRAYAAHPGHSGALHGWVRTEILA